jgi:hypothetical protein
MKRPAKFDWIKISVALLLLVCFFLPFSSCQHSVDENGVYTFYSHKPAVRTVLEYSYPWERLNRIEWEDLLFLICFIWPVPVLAFRFLSSRKILLLVCWIMEPVLAVGSLYFVCFFSNFLSKPEIGAYLMEAGYCIYLAAWFSEAVMIVIRKRRLKTE